MRRPAFVIAALLAASAAASPSGAAADSMTLRFNRWIPVTHFTQSEVLDRWAADIAKATQDRVKVEFTASSLAPPPRQYQLAVDGVSDLVWHSHSYTPGVFPLSEIVELPFTGDSAEAISVAYWRVYKKHFEPANMHRGVVTLALHVTPPGHVYNNKRAIRTMEDFRGLKLRSTNALVTEALKMFGAVPIAAPVTEIRDGLSKGVMDGTTFTDDAVMLFKVDQFIKYATKIPGGIYNQSFVIAMTPRKWEAISPADREAIMKLSGEAFAHRMGGTWDKVAAKGTEDIKKAGVEMHWVEGDMLATIKKMLEPFEQKWLSQAKAAGVDGEGALAMLRQEIASFKPRN
jgi:TRAP-type C4-dicarboxylate transport system substrate-binding protein